jgi:hypothetical protein
LEGIALFPEYTLGTLGTWLAQWIEEAQTLNANDNPARCRELSLAITNAEQALHWIAAREQSQS